MGLLDLCPGRVHRAVLRNQTDIPAGSSNVEKSALDPTDRSEECVVAKLDLSCFQFQEPSIGCELNIEAQLGLGLIERLKHLARRVKIKTRLARGTVKVTDTDIKTAKPVGIAQRKIARRLITVSFECCGAFIDWERQAHAALDTRKFPFAEVRQIMDVEVADVGLPQW